MRVAFICEGDSEAESVQPLLSKLGIIVNYIRDKREKNRGKNTVYIHNLKSVTKVDSFEYVTLLDELIYRYKFEKIIIWFDQENFEEPLCQKALRHQKKIKEEGQGLDGKIIFCISNKKLENWIFTNKKIFLDMFEIKEKDLSKKSKQIFDREDVDGIGVSKELRIANKKAGYKFTNKQSFAKAFFERYDRNKKYRSKSFNRFIERIFPVFDT